LIAAWLAATVLSGAPSTMYALLVHADMWQATRAAGAMLLRADAPLQDLVIAAAIVHSVISAGWAALLACILPLRAHRLVGFARGRHHRRR
jgi:hypothetical protein